MTNKPLLANHDKAVCRQHFLLVGSVISLLLTVIATVFGAREWYYYSPLLYFTAAGLVTFFSTWKRRIRLLFLSSVLVLVEVAVKLVAFVILSHQRVRIYRGCYLQQEICHY